MLYTGLARILQGKELLLIIKMHGISSLYLKMVVYNYS